MTMFCWTELSSFSDAEVGALDIAEVNLACAGGLPGAEALEVGCCLATLDAWAERVARETSAWAHQFERDPDQFEGSWAYFRTLVLATVLQEDLGVRYDPTLVDRDDFFQFADRIFVHGVTNTKRGTCSSLPPVYVAVGRRLGYPLKLVQTACHLFARWDDAASGERLNIECTSRGLNCHSDEYYQEWPVATTPEDVARCRWLVSMGPSAELACFLAHRGHCCLDNGRIDEAVECYAEASRIAPWHRGYAECLRDAVAKRGG